MENKKQGCEMRKIAALFMVILALLAVLSCSKIGPAGPEPFPTATPTSTVISGTGLLIEAELSRNETSNSSCYSVYVKVALTPYPHATVTLEDLDSAAGPQDLPYFAGLYGICGDLGSIAPGHEYMVSVTVDGIAHTASAVAPGDISIDSDGMTVSWGYGQPYGNGGIVEIYKTDTEDLIYSSIAWGPSPYTLDYDHYIPGDGLHRFLLQMYANYFEYEGSGAFEGCNIESNILILTTKQREDINK